ncbi:hypothetical protein [Hymenobacter sp. HDW8]|uniref:hypothetical protein n=1 Tax=Hymenobacter sp. HDW8 TaxID=2714932 RepID=UPI00140CAF35|nr:hypothetical protein [Hymenobacter sp. HDW8]QIL75899.1 hypothetical protein G7064_08550 [Hymenobacter sp. HDW8]
MEDNKKKAYRYLLYAFILDLRTIPVDGTADSLTEEMRIKYISYAGAVAYLLHNFALTASNDFEDFDEQQFWYSIDCFNQKNPAIAASHFKQIFEDRLLELNQS